MIITQKNPSKRTHALRKMVKIAHECWKIGNFHAVFGIIAGLNWHCRKSTVEAVSAMPCNISFCVVHRLKELDPRVCLASRELHKYKALYSLQGSDNNYKRYRDELELAKRLPRGPGEAVTDRFVCLLQFVLTHWVW